MLRRTERKRNTPNHETKALPIIPEKEMLVEPEFEIRITSRQIREILSRGYPDYPAARTRMTDEEYDTWVEFGRPASALEPGVYHHPNYLKGLERGLATWDDGTQNFADETFTPTFDPRGMSRDSHGRPLHPYVREMLIEGVALAGPGFYWEYGPNRTADSVVLRERDGKLQVLLIKRKDTGQLALPGGMLDRNEPNIPAALRELLEEATVDLKDVAYQVVHQGVVVDPRMTLNSWPETTVVLLLPDNETANRMVPQGGSDATAAMWADVNEETLSKLFASHIDFAKVATRKWQEDRLKVVRKDGVIGTRSASRS